MTAAVVNSLTGLVPLLPCTLLGGAESSVEEAPMITLEEAGFSMFCRKEEVLDERAGASVLAVE